MQLHIEMNQDKLRFLEFNLGILFISTSAVLGRYITTSSSLTTFYRCIIAVFCLGVIVKILGHSYHFNWRKHGFVMIGSSVLMAFHWTAYFYSLDYSNVSIGLMTIYTFPAMTAIIEPIWHGRRIPTRDIVLAIVALCGIFVIAPPMTSSEDIQLAILLGVLSALAYSIRNVWIVKTSQEYAGTTFMFYQLGWMSILLLPFFIQSQERFEEIP